MRAIIDGKVQDIVIVDNHLTNKRILKGMIEIAIADHSGSIDRKYCMHMRIYESEISNERKVTYKDASYTQMVEHTLGKDVKTWRADIGNLTVAIECKTKAECQKRVREWLRLNPITVLVGE